MRRKALLLVLVVSLAACSSGTAPTSVAPVALPRGWNGTAKYVSHVVGHGADATLTIEVTEMRWIQDPLVAPLGDGTVYQLHVYNARLTYLSTAEIGGGRCTETGESTLNAIFDASNGHLVLYNSGNYSGFVRGRFAVNTRIACPGGSSRGSGEFQMDLNISGQAAVTSGRLKGSDERPPRAEGGFSGTAESTWDLTAD